jgi:tetratricopeptide (TPR) repeat protein
MATINPTEITQCYQKALVLQNSGQHEDALKLFSNILEVKPDIAEVHFQVAKIFYTGNKFTKSLFHFDLALQLKQNEPAIWDAFINCLLCNADINAIKQAAKRLKATKIDKKIVTALATKLLRSKDQAILKISAPEKQAVDKVQRLLKEHSYQQANIMALGQLSKHKNSAAIAELVAQTFSFLSDFDSARKYFRQSLSLNPNFFNATINFAQAELAMKNYESAAALFKSAILMAPRASGALLGLAQTIKDSGNLKDCQDLLKNMSILLPRNGKVDRELGKISFNATANIQAVAYFKSAQDKGERSAQLHIELGAALVAARDFDGAWAQYEIAQEMEPSNHNIYYRQALALQEFANFDEAIKRITKAISLAPEETNYQLIYTNLQKFEAGDPFIDTLIARHGDPKVSIEDRTELGFAVAKVLEDSQQYDRVFKFLKNANDDMNSRYPYEVNDFEKEIDGVCAYFDDFKLLDFEGKGDQAAEPIFVCGMPRSGTTLVEQIISSHSRVSGAGEVGFASGAEVRAMGNKDGTLKKLNTLGQAELKSLGDEVDTYLKGLFENPDRVSDKSIQTYKRMGLLKAAMPNCKIIVVRRDPRDNLLSIYRNKFVDGTHLYAYNLSDLGAYYKQFVRIIDFWREKMPEGFMEIQYEDLIDDPEKHARALIDYCDLEWEDDCLNFHKSKRQVKTLSVYQVRQPIYKSSVKAWQRYEKDLKPLFEALK